MAEPGTINGVVTLGGKVDQEPARADEPTGKQRRSSGGRSILAWVVGFLVVVLGAEGAVRLADSRLPEPLRYYSSDAQRIVDDMDVLRRAHVTSDVTFVGTSMVRRDIDADLIERELPGIKWANNVALPGAQTPIVESWLLDQVIPRIHSKRVVWGVSSLDFNAGRPDHPIDQYERARATQPGTDADLDRLIEHLALSDHRDALRDPLTLQDAVSGQGTTFAPRRPLQERAVWKLGYPKATPQQIAKARANHLRTVRDKQLAGFRIGDREIEAYSHTLTELKRQGIEVAVVVMPVPSGYLAAHPHGASDFDSWKTTITAAAAKIGVAVIDMSKTMPDAAFRDYEHLEVAPARKFTSMVADRLRTRGW